MLRGLALSWLVRLWVATLRVRCHGQAPSGPVVLAFWHGDQLALLGALPRDRAWVTMTSLSHDGALQTEVMRRLGIGAVRGSSSRGAAAGARGLIRVLRLGCGGLVACDGPRGPRGVAKPGAAFVAKAASAPLVGVGVAVGAAVRLTRAWDRFCLPLPWSRVQVVIGPPVAQGASLEAAIAACETQAEALLEAWP